jgi:serine protease AprX
MNPTTLICPLCRDTVDKLLYRFHLGSERQVIERIKKSNPVWAENDGACSRCIDYYHTEIIIQQRILPEIGPYFPVKSADDFVILPTGLRIDADPRYTGKGVTICFIDSGFYPHPDLVKYNNRIKAIINIANHGQQNQTANWHGTMTSVVCAGDGCLSNGLYKGIACDSELVLLKVQDEEGKITTASITAALHWINNNHKKYAIRIVNMSVGDGEVDAGQKSEVNQLAEKLIEQGITIVAAVGNDENGSIKPPANSPNTISVGGIDDENSLQKVKKLYHSSYTKTTGGYMKPELTAPAIWIAAPILPGTKEETESQLLHDLLQSPDDLLCGKLETYFSQTGLEQTILQTKDVNLVREGIRTRMQHCKYISPHYMHVDGTSFAAPIVSSVIAQLLEADPKLTPAMIRETIFGTAKRIAGFPADRQGFGVIQPGKALLKILRREMNTEPSLSPMVNRQQKIIGFSLYHDCASSVSLSGSFNKWMPGVLQFEPVKNGLWKIEIPMLPAGKYQYKFCINDETWMEDVNNPLREPDGLNGFNSILLIEN